MKLATILALTALSAPLAAQAPVWEDDFNDGIVDPMWTITFNPLQFWNTGEFGGFYHFDGLTAPFGAFNEIWAMDAPAPAQTGAVQFKTSLIWEENQYVTGGLSQLNTKIELHDANGIVIAQIFLNDTSTTAGPELEFTAGGLTSTVAGLLQTSSADIEIARDGSGAWTYSVSGAAGTHSGSMGNDGATIENVNFHTTVVSAGVGQPPLGVCDIDYLELYAGAAGPSLAVTGSCPGQMTASVSGMTANGPVVFVRGFAGSTLVPNGACAGLSVPVSSAQRLATVTADVNGDASLTANAPAAACGAISIVAVDGATCTVTNVIAL